jgi:GT2 family glycosyltransferase
MAEPFQKPKWNTFVIPVIIPGLIDRCLETLYKYTEEGTFYVFVIDQTIEGLDPNLRDKYKNLMLIRTPKSDIHYTGNLGHSQASNLGIRLVETPYVTFLNDDVEFVSDKWWQGVLDTFKKVEEATPDRPAIMVNPASIKLPDWSVGRKDGDDFYILPYQEEYSEKDYDFLVNEKHLINEHLTLIPGSVIDGVNLYCSVCDTQKLLEVGLVDDWLYPGSANDYDLSCRAGMFGYRTVGTTLSWVYHHWSVTFHSDVQKNQLLQPELVHGDLRDKWGDRLDIWGPKCSQAGCEERLRTYDGGRTATCSRHPDELYTIPQNTVMPL